MTFPVFASGDVLNASDMNAVGLWKLTAGSFSAVTSFSLPNDTFTSTYDNYKIIVHISATTTNCTLTMRLRASGTDNSSAVYFQGSPGYDTLGAAANINVDGGTSWSAGGVVNAAPIYGLQFDLLQPKAALRTTAVGTYFSAIAAFTAHAGRTFTATHNSTTAFDSLSLISSVASSITGTYKVYGYQN